MLGNRLPWSESYFSGRDPKQSLYLILNLDAIQDFELQLRLLEKLVRRVQGEKSSGKSKKCGTRGSKKRGASDSKKRGIGDLRD
jgi:hypothetical protein